MLIRELRLQICMPATQEGIGLIRQGKDHVRLISAGISVGIDHGDAVEQMPGIHHDGCEHRRQNGCPSVSSPTPTYCMDPA